jgi:cysteinyl-tRNA synthetase
MDIYLTNSLTRKKEKFIPLNTSKIGMYTCGPTVYNFATIGNFRTYLSADILLRTLKYNGYKVDYIMNLTDVGHLTGDNLGDADTGEDRMEKEAKKERKTAWEVAKEYTEAFLTDLHKLNLEDPDNFVKATDHIKEQISLVKELEEKGLTYKISDGIYFDTASYEKNTGFKYGEMSNLDQIKEGARVEVNPEKKNPRDFALWKFSPEGVRRDMEWDSPWGVGFPGWHIECSAMSMKYLGETFDIHVGGEDLKSTHHPNEIAQSQGATGKKFVDYWIHGAFLTVDGGRMGKSLGNAYTIADLEKKGFSPLDLRYFYLSGKYNEPLNFTWESLKAAQVALSRLKSQITNYKSQGSERTMLSPEKEKQIETFRANFTEAINDDLNTPKALSVFWSMLSSNIPSVDKYDLAINFDEVLGLKLSEGQDSIKQIPTNIQELMTKREQLRKDGKFEEADKIRDEIKNAGFDTSDKQL